MDEFDTYSILVDSDIIGQDLDDIDPYAEFTDVNEYDDYDDGGILYE